MQRTHRVAAGALAGALLATVLATGAAADTVEATFTVTNSGGLAVTAASATSNLGSVDTSGASAVTGTLPTVTVSDTRNPLLGGWSVAAAATSFSDGAATPHVIEGADVDYWSGAALVVSGVVVPVGQQVDQLVAVDLSTTRSAVVATGASGNNSASFTPSLSIDVSGAPDGTYTGSIVHSVTGS